MTTTTPTLTMFDTQSLAGVRTEVLTPDFFSDHVTPFGPGEMTLGHVAGPEGAGGVDLWTADQAGFETGPKPQAEVAFILEGVLRLTPTGGEPIDVTAGQGYYLPVGWAGRIEAVEAVRKVYLVL